MLSRKISGAKLRRIREDRCLRVAEVAEAVGCSHWNIYKIEKGTTQPSAYVYAALKAVLQVDDSDLVDASEGAA
ncbi:helix-turn-helix domain-containing protein [Streptomyces sp. NPDC016626]|uniref:helix-turn-helix domain-containing protein n=1 Tax=Streptomyces sp. NPDC016626 TaxID=3364968 RepID=UPI0036FCBB7C